MTIDHGTGLRLAGGDLVFTEGRPDQVSGLANLMQALTLRVLTPLGSDPYDVRYGFDAAAVFTGPGGVSEVIDLLRLNLVRTLGSDPRVRDLRDIQITDVPGSGRRTWRVEVSIVAVDGGSFTLGLDLGGQR
jgi:hypothetical protein